jgi:hypothetical protein
LRARQTIGTGTYLTIDQHTRQKVVDEIFANHLDVGRVNIIDSNYFLFRHTLLPSDDSIQRWFQAGLALSIRAAALILATWTTENAPKAVKQSRLGFAPQNGHFSDSGLIGSTGIFGFATARSMTHEAMIRYGDNQI